MRLQESLRKLIKYQEDAVFVYPSAIAAAFIFLAIVLDLVLGNQSSSNDRLVTFGVGLGGSVYIILQIVLIAPRLQKYRRFYIWANAAISGIGLSLLALVLDEAHHTYYSILIILTVISISILSGRGPTYLLIVLSGLSYILIHQSPISGFLGWSVHILPILASIAVTETILRLRQVTQNHIRSLESINLFSQQINSSLETNQVLSLLNAALQKAITADSYFVGLVENGAIRLDLLYDDGEFFSDVKIPLENTLAGWVIKNKSSLFLADIRNGIPIPNIERKIIGKDKLSNSWIGVPMNTVHIRGLLAVSSYKANAFSHTDMELLSNMAQHAALALDNTVHHKQVEEQSRLDSLTGTYNHRYFLQSLQEHIEEARPAGQVLSLIMLDIDFFKSYNDSFGHQVGDMVLKTLCETIQKNIKKGDFVGRWGGEEFGIALPGAKGLEAHQVAMRIQETMLNLVLDDSEYDQLPAPTVSQGISVFPDEAKEIDRLIYLADKRLYKAKERGRNQIEPDPSHWKTIQSTKRMPGA
ncbi:MAG: diguanylate cyclase [Anaerolineales bacterium]